MTRSTNLRQTLAGLGSAAMVVLLVIGGCPGDPLAQSTDAFGDASGPQPQDRETRLAGAGDIVLPPMEFKADHYVGSPPLSVVVAAYTLNGEALPEGTYRWNVAGVEDAGPVATHARRGYTFQAVGTYTISLTLTVAGITQEIGCAQENDAPDPHPAKVVVMTAPPPTFSLQAMAGPDQTVTCGQRVTLDGSASQGDGGAPPTYRWSQVSGEGVTLSDATNARPQFDAKCLMDGRSRPIDRDHELIFELEVSAGDRTDRDTVTVHVQAAANALEYSSDPADDTGKIAAAIASGFRRVLIPDKGSAWQVRPLRLKSNQEIIFEPGTVLEAKQGGYPNQGDCLLTLELLENVRLRGNGATIRMRKDEYTDGQWRHCVRIQGSRNITIEGLHLERAGGDGIYIGSSDRTPSRSIVVRDCVCDENHRQGISVISAEGLLIERCTLKNTAGVGPSAGIDFEPNHTYDVLRDVLVKECVAENNAQYGFIFVLLSLDQTSPDISVRLEDCRTVGGMWGIRVADNRPGAAPDTPGPGGVIEFVRCEAENPTAYGTLYTCARAAPARVATKFIDHKSTHTRSGHPLLVRMPLVPSSPGDGGLVEFRNCVVCNTTNSSFLTLESVGPIPDGGAYFNVSGNITVYNTTCGACEWSRPPTLPASQMRIDFHEAACPD
jgi:hypothetical protein